MTATLDQIKELRNATGAGISAVKEALEHSKGDREKAILYLREKGIAKAAKRADKRAENGFIAHYIHGEGTIGVLVELNSETDFTARNEKFRKLANDLAIHIAAANPQYISTEDVPEEIMKKEKELAEKGLENKPDEIKEKIIEGKLQKVFEDIVLLEQNFVKDDSKKIKDLLNETIAAVGEKIEIGRFVRMQISGSGTGCNL
jgi:elongation factor Ts